MDLQPLIDKLIVAPDDPARARAFGRMAFMEWLGALPGDVSFPLAAMEAYDRTRAVARISYAAEVFRALLVEAVHMPPRPLSLTLPSPHRRGGARTRRLPF